MADRVVTQAKNLIKQTEGYIPGVYRDPKGIATIGYGYALVTSDGGNPPTWKPRRIDEIKEDLRKAGVKFPDQDLDTLKTYLTSNAAALNGDASSLNDQIPSDQKGASGVTFNGTAAGYKAPPDLQFLSISEPQASTLLTNHLNATTSHGENVIHQNVVNAVYNNIDDSSYPGMTAHQLKDQISANIKGLPTEVQAVLHYTAYASGASDPYLGKGTADNDATSQIAKAIIPPGNVTRPNVVGASGVVDQLSTNTFGKSKNKDLVRDVRHLLGTAVTLDDKGHPIGGLTQTGNAGVSAADRTGDGEAGVPINGTATQNAAGETASLSFTSRAPTLTAEQSVKDFPSSVPAAPAEPAPVGGAAWSDLTPEAFGGAVETCDRALGADFLARDYDPEARERYTERQAEMEGYVTQAAQDKSLLDGISSPSLRQDVERQVAERDGGSPTQARAALAEIE